MKFVFEVHTPSVTIPERRRRVMVHAGDLMEAKRKLSDRIDSEIFSFKVIEPKEPKKEHK